MDRKPICTIHPRAQEILFEQKRKLSKIFREVLGHYEMDHLSIAVIKKNHEIFFLSSTPSIEFNLIEKNLWIYDDSYDPDFFRNPQCKLWSELFHKEKFIELRFIKQIVTGYVSGFSASVEFNNFYLVYSFATKSKRLDTEMEFFGLSNSLIKLGNFCFKKIVDEIFPVLFTNVGSINLIRTPRLKLVANNGLLLE